MSPTGSENVIVAAGQVSVERGNVRANVEKHIAFIEAASDCDASLIVFPEMSLTGYEREEAGDYALDARDPHLSAIQAVASERNIAVIAGAPVRVGEALHIASFVFRPAGPRALYTKKHLHAGEDVVFTRSDDHDPIVQVVNERVSCAICFDIENTGHPAKAASRNATVYAAGIFYSPRGMDDAHRVLQSYAQTYAMTVVMANYCDMCWDMQSGGRSAIWSAEGTMTIDADDAHETLLVATKARAGWSGQRVRVG